VVLSVIHHRLEPFRIFLLLFIKLTGYKNAPENYRYNQNLSYMFWKRGFSFFVVYHTEYTHL
jgi:hypothetical protein